MESEKKMTADIVKEFGKHGQDTGSVEVQVALCTEHVKDLTEHLKTHKKDYSSKNGLNKLLARRKRLLQYLKQNDEEQYRKVIKLLGLKK